MQINERAICGTATGFLEAAGDWAFLLDQDQVIRYCHKSAAAQGGILPSHLIGRPFASFLPLACREEMAQLLTGENLPRQERQTASYRDDFGGLHLLQASALREEGEFAGCYVIIRQMTGYDVPEIVGTFGDERVPLQEAIFALSRDFAAAQDLDGVIQRALRQVGEYLQVDRCCVFTHNHEEKTYSCTYEWHSQGVPPHKELLQNVSYSDEDDGFSQITNDPYIQVEDTFQYQGDAYRAQREAGVHAFVDLPILVRGKVWGFLGADVSNGVRKWQPGDMVLLQTVNSALSHALEKYCILEELHSTVARLEGIVASYPGAIFSVDQTRRFTLVAGSSAGSILDCALPEELLGASIYDTGVPPEVTRLVEDTLTRGAQSCIYDRGGCALTCETGLLYDREGHMNGMVGVALDISSIQNTHRELVEATRQARQASSAKSDFLSWMSHEIRTPMSAIVGMTAIAQGSRDGEKTAYCLEKIEEATRQMLAIVNNILDLSKIETGKLELVPTEFSFPAALQSALDVTQIQAQAKGQEIVVQLESDFERHLVCDEMRLTQVMGNLLSNAIKFTPEGERIAVRARHLEREGKPLLQVEVADHGIGISPEAQEKLFLAFSQADKFVSHRFGGSGLGLAICKEICLLMGGDIRVESAPGQGSRFTFEVEAPWGEGTGEPPKEAAPAALPDWRGKTILLAEDVAINREILLAHLEATGACLVAVENGREAVEAMGQRPGEFALVLMDVQMPEMDGLEATRQIRRMEGEGPRTPIVAMTANAFADDVRECLAAGMDIHLAKPVRPQALLNALRHYLDDAGSN